MLLAGQRMLPQSLFIEPARPRSRTCSSCCSCCSFSSSSSAAASSCASSREHASRAAQATGAVYEIDKSPYYTIESLWNAANYWARP
jgi:hypothetical protein